MAAPMPLTCFEGLGKENYELCTIEATVVTGFEPVAKEECKEKLSSDSLVARGRIIFDTRINDIDKVLQLRSVDSVYVIIADFPDFNFPKDKEEALAKIESIVSEVDWNKGLVVWEKVFKRTNLSGIKNIDFNENKESNNITQISPEADERESQEVGNASLDNNNIQMVRFRVTCNRAGKNHSFGSPDAAAHLGASIIEKFGWKADMTRFNIEVVLNIADEHMYVGFALTTESLHRRNIEFFGPTTLRSTIAYNMLRLACIKNGEVVCDPMCGGGSIPIEASISWPNAYHICGDIHELAWPRTVQNINAINAKRTKENKSSLQLDVFQWDVEHLPLRTNSVDVFVTDMPFGKRSGSKIDNRQLYPKTLREMARVGKCSSARAVILTQDKKNMIRTLQKLTALWKNPRTLNVNIGGLAGAAFLLFRTSQEVKIVNR